MHILVLIWGARISTETVVVNESPNYGLSPMLLHLPWPFEKQLLPTPEIFSGPYKNISREIKTRKVG